MIKVERKFSFDAKEFFVAVLVREGKQGSLSMQSANDKQGIKLCGD